jgi:hypothetical protein
VNDVLLIIVVLAVAIGGLVGVAYLLQRRSRASGAVGPELPRLGPLGKTLLWIIRGLVAIMVLAIVGVFVLQSIYPVWVAGGALLGYLVVRAVFPVVRAAGK